MIPLAKPIKYSLRVPGSKSLMNRALLCAALASGVSHIKDPIYCEDTDYMIKTLRGLGIKIRTTPSIVTVHGSLQRLLRQRRIRLRRKFFLQRLQRFYIGNAGTVKRFLTPFLPVGSLVGNQRMTERPNQDLEQAVAQLKLTSTIKITGKVSSQFISALLMYAPTVGKKVSIQVTGKLVSAPYVQMTVQMMKQFGVRVQERNHQFIIAPQQYRASVYTVEGDASSATYWWALAAISGSHITVENIPIDTLQPDAKFKQLMARMGCTVRGNTVIGPWDHTLKAVNVNMSDYPDAVMSAAIVMTQAKGQSTITGIGHLAHKETDRLALLHLNLRKLGISARRTKDSLTIIGRDQALWKHTVQTGNDHRFAMAFAILGVTVDDKTCVKKSYPTFWKDFQKIKQQAKTQTLILTGMRGVGKTTYGKELAKLYKTKFIDTDAMIVETHSNASLQGCIQQKGWSYFRNLEYQAVKKIHNQKNTVIATGGGTLMYPRNVKLLKQHYIVLLTAPIAVLKQRLAKQSHRPTLKKNSTVTSELVEIWNERKKKYDAVADNIYDGR